MINKSIKKILMNHDLKKLIELKLNLIADIEPNIFYKITEI